MLKILFLDVDGVLNSMNTYQRMMTAGQDPIEPDLVKRVQKIVDATGAKIVISSTWRFFKTLDWFRALLQREVMDATGQSQSFRGKEIDGWISGDHPDSIYQYVILDDDRDMMPHQLSHVVQVSAVTGLTDADVEKAINILGRKP